MAHDTDIRAPRAPQGRPPIVIVDDDPHMRKLLRDLLTDEGLSVREAEDGEHLIEVLEVAPPTLVVLDKEMPGPNGLDLLSYVARRHPSLPVMLITAFGGVQVRTEALARGAAAYLEKPFRIDAFLREIDRLIHPDQSSGLCRPGLTELGRDRVR